MKGFNAHLHNRPAQTLKKTTRLSTFKLHYEALKQDRKPYLTPQKPTLLEDVKGILSWCKRKLVTRLEQISRHKFRDFKGIRNFLKKAAGLFPRRVRWEWLAIAILLSLLLTGHRAQVIPEQKPIAATYTKHVAPLKPKIPAKVPAVPLKPVAQPVAAPTPVYVPPAGVTNCGSDPNMAFIYQHESGCRTNAIGPNGPCGLGQALPCSKLPCSLSDWACQNAWFTSYAIRTYGSTYAAYLFWVAHSWW